MASQPPPPPGQGGGNLPRASMAERPDLSSYAPSYDDDPEPLPLSSLMPPAMGQSQKPSASIKPSNAPTSYVSSSRAGGTSQHQTLTPSCSQSGNYQSSSPSGQSNRPPRSSLAHQIQSQRVPSSSQHPNYGQSQKVSSGSHYQNYGQTSRVPSSSRPPTSQHQSVGQSQRYVSSKSPSQYPGGQRLDPPGATGLPTISEVNSFKPTSTRPQSGSSSRPSSRSSSRGPSVGQSIMNTRLDKSPQSVMPVKIDPTRGPSRAPSVIPSAPPGQPSLLTSNLDKLMASRQMSIASMSGREKEEQDRWAQGQIKLTAGCPENYTWESRFGGYQCKGGGHGVTDALLVEGKGGIVRCLEEKWGNFKGPYYKDGEGRWIRSTANDAPK